MDFSSDLNLPYIEPQLLVLAIIAALGMSLVTSAIANVRDLRRVRWPWSKTVDIETEMRRLQGETEPESESLLDRALAPLARLDATN